MHGAQRVNVVITLALLLVARRALAATVVVAFPPPPPAQLVAPGSRAPDLTRPVDNDRPKKCPTIWYGFAGAV